MTKAYELTLLKEVLHEVGAGVYADCVAFERTHNIDAEKEPNHPMVKLEQAIWDSMQRIFTVNTTEELERIQGSFDFAKDYLVRLEQGNAS